MTDMSIGRSPVPPAAARDGRLRDVLDRARGGVRAGFSERWLLPIGGALAVAGLASIVVGWAGTSRTVLVAGQIPYLVSGGLLGLGLVFLGGFLYFGYWVAQLGRETREHSDADRAELARLRAGIDEVNRSLAGIAQLLARAPARPATSRAPGTTERAAVGPAPHLVATRSGTMVHRPDCPVVAGKPDLHDAEGDGLRPCGICHPLAAPAPDAATPAPAGQDG